MYAFRILYCIVNRLTHLSSYNNNNIKQHHATHNGRHPG